jgi:hypothetical protein
MSFKIDEKCDTSDPLWPCSHMCQRSDWYEPQKRSGQAIWWIMRNHGLANYTADQVKHFQGLGEGTDPSLLQIKSECLQSMPCKHFCFRPEWGGERLMSGVDIFKAMVTEGLSRHTEDNVNHFAEYASHCAHERRTSEHRSTTMSAFPMGSPSASSASSASSAAPAPMVELEPEPDESLVCRFPEPEPEPSAECGQFRRRLQAAQDTLHRTGRSVVVIDDTCVESLPCQHMCQRPEWTHPKLYDAQDILAEMRKDGLAFHEPRNVVHFCIADD